MSYSLLYVDDRPLEIQIPELLGDDFHVTFCRTLRHFNDLLQGDAYFHAAIVDYKLGENFPGADGIKITTQLIDRFPDIGVVGISGYLEPTLDPNGNDTKADWMLAGARHFCDRSVITARGDFSLSLSIVRRAAERAQYHKEREQELAQRLGGVDLYRYPDLIAAVPDLNKVMKSNSILLLQGKTGTGKGVMARFIHSRGPRAEHPFVSINCGALPEHLWESELFGYEKGAFTDAKSAKPGKFELADKGTLFLDEIAEIPLHLQPKLLSATEEHKIDRLGARASVDIDVRLIAATNKTLFDQVSRREFREDLYYRLAVLTLSLPTLAQRPRDVPILIDDLLCTMNLRHCRDVVLDDQSRQYLEKRDYPGNVRELENLLDAIVLLTDSDRPSLDDITTIVARQTATTTYAPRRPAISTQKDYADRVADWMDQHLSDITSGVYRKKARFAVEAMEFVRHNYEIITDSADKLKTEYGAGYLYDILKRHRPDTRNRVLSALPRLPARSSTVQTKD